MKITVSQLRKIIREEVENLSANNFEVGDFVEEKGTDSGWWKILELIPDNRTGKTVATLKMFQPVGGRTPTTYVTTDKLIKIPYDDVVHQIFMALRDEKGEVPLEKLAKELGVDPKKIDWSKTSLRVINGVVTELLGDTPFRTDR